MANPNTVQATETSFRVVEALVDRGGAGVSDLAADLDLSRSGVHKHLRTLCELGYARKEGGVYRVSDQLFGLGTRARACDRVFQASREPLVDLASAMNERVSLYRRRDDRLTCLFTTADRNQPGRPLPEGTTVPLSDSFVGGVVLAQGDDGEADPFAETVDDLQTIRGHHVVFETDGDVRRIAMAVIGPGGDVVGVVVVSGTTGRLKGRRVGEDAPGLMVSTVETIESALDESVPDR